VQHIFTIYSVPNIVEIGQHSMWTPQLNEQGVVFLTHAVDL